MKIYFLLLLLTACSAVTLAQDNAAKPEVPPIRNFLRVNENFCTGGQPRLEHLEHLEQLKAEGVKAIINLRPPTEHRAAEEEEMAKKLGLRYVNIPVVYTAPKEEDATEFLKATDAPANRPAFIHCAAAIRVGAFWMIRRVLRDGWTIEKAEEEAKKVGLVNAPHLSEFARNYIEKHQKKSATNQGRSKAMTNGKQREVATLAGGCFWCLEAVYKELRGVDKVVSGYAGGHVANPSYKQVVTGATGHAEVVQITYDPQQVTYNDLVTVFFTIHDPTTLNRQGPDVGTQYRSAIFYHSPEQKAVAEQVVKEITDAKIWDKPLVTEVTSLDKFYKAEDYHQDYFMLNPGQAYCRMVIAPKVNKFRKQFAAKLKRAS